MTSALLSLAAAAALALLLAWFASGLLLRIGGGTLAFSGLAVTAAGHGALIMTPAALAGAVLWLAGHWIYAARHHCYRSPLARRVFLTVLPARLDPSRGWGIPTVPPGARR